MKLQLMFLLMDFLMLLGCSYFWLKFAIVRALGIAKS